MSFTVAYRHVEQHANHTYMENRTKTKKKPYSKQLKYYLQSSKVKLRFVQKNGWHMRVESKCGWKSIVGWENMSVRRVSILFLAGKQKSRKSTHMKLIGVQKQQQHTISPPRVKWHQQHTHKRITHDDRDEIFPSTILLM